MIGRVVALIMALIATSCDAPTGAEQSARIKESCEREFGAGTDQSANCQATLIAEAMEERRQGDMSRARTGAR